MIQNTTESFAGYFGIAPPVRAAFPARISMLEYLIELLCRPSIFLIAVTALVASQSIDRGEFFFHTDEMYHAMNGLFVRDFVVDLPLHHPLQYAYEYYAKYPAVVLLHWPPLFYITEGIAILVLGISSYCALSRLSRIKRMWQCAIQVFGYRAELHAQIEMS